MGKAIVYCQSCGKSLREEDFERGRAVKLANQNYCAECRPQEAAPAPPPPPRRELSDRFAAVRLPDAERPGSTARVPKVPEPGARSPSLLWISVIVVGVVCVLAAIVLSTRSDIRESPIVAPPPPPPPPRPKPPEPPPIERDVAMLRGLLIGAPKNWNTRDIDVWFKNATDHGGARREDVEQLRKDYQRGLRILDLREGLVGRWPLDEADGAVARDASGRGNDAKIVGTLGRMPGRFGGAFQFRGGEDCVELPKDRDFDIRFAACYTICAWVMPDNLPPGKGASANDSVYGILIRNGMHVGLSLNREGRVAMSQWLAGNKQVSAGSTEKISPNTWSHVAAVVDSRMGRTLIYLNGKLAGETAWPAPKTAGIPLESLWRIGIGLPNAKEWGWSMRGLIDEVLFYARPLGPEEIALLAEGVLPPEEDPRKADVSDAGLELQLRADRDVKLDGTLVSSWTDSARGIAAISDAKDRFPSLSSIDGQPWLKFEGKNHCLDIPHRPTLAFEEADSFTLAIRVQLAAAPKGRWQGVVAKSLDAGTWYGLWIDDRGHWVFGSAQNLHGAPAKAGVSTVVAVQEGGKERRLYVDGRRVATGPAASAAGTGPLRIGGSTRKEFFEGQIQEVRLWRRALDPAEVRALTK